MRTRYVRAVAPPRPPDQRSSHHAKPARHDAFLARLNATGEVFMTPTVLHGRPAVRAAFSNWSTTDADVVRILAAISSVVTAPAELAS